MGRLGAILGVLEPSWPVLGASWGHLGPSWEQSWAASERSQAIWELSGAVWERCWPPGPPMEESAWAPPGASNPEYMIQGSYGRKRQLQAPLGHPKSFTGSQTHVYIIYPSYSIFVHLSELIVSCSAEVNFSFSSSIRWRVAVSSPDHHYIFGNLFDSKVNNIFIGCHQQYVKIAIFSDYLSRKFQYSKV